MPRKHRNQRESNYRWRKANPEKVATYAKKWNDKNRERIRGYYYKRHYLRKLGLSREQADEYFRISKQCGICASEKDLILDHNHITGMVRGVLCRRCNIAGGIFKDDPQLILRAAVWFSKF